MIAYCWRTGELHFGEAMPSGTLLISNGRGDEWEDMITAQCRRAYDGVTLLVPGVPEAESDEEAMEAVKRFRLRIVHCTAVMKQNAREEQRTKKGRKS